MTPRPWFLFAAALWTAPALAQEPVAEPTTPTEADAQVVAAMTAAPEAAPKDLMQRALDSIALPAKAEDLRASGMHMSEVLAALNAMNEAGLTSTQAIELLDAATIPGGGDAWEGSFGVFLADKLEDGQKGAELVATIKAERDDSIKEKAAAKAAGTWKSPAADAGAEGGSK
jgi:hypothetical protein